MKDFAVRYLQEYAKHFKKPSSYKSDASNLSHHVLPLIGTKKVDEVSRADIEYVKNSFREGKTAARKAAKFRGRSIIKGGLGVANRVVALMSMLMACSVEWGSERTTPHLKLKNIQKSGKTVFFKWTRSGGYKMHLMPPNCKKLKRAM